MRPLWKDVLTAIWLGMIVPGIVLNAFVLKQRHQQTQKISVVQMEKDVESGPFITVQATKDDSLEMELDTYLTGVVLAEMPAAFHEEALKAQAAAARTYTWKAHTTGGKHGDGSICTDASCCQAFITEESYLTRGGTVENLEKARQAVESTSPFVLTYEGELIEAIYFSSSGGSTEDALAVWGTEYPYLQAVSSPEETVVDTRIYTKPELEQCLGITLSEHPEEWFGAVTYTKGDGIASIEIGDETFTGTQLRAVLGLRSTDFEVETDGGNIIITTRGYGHRVGMSQYGANAMAESGSTWQKILQHYYPGAILVPAY